MSPIIFTSIRIRSKMFSHICLTIFFYINSFYVVFIRRMKPCRMRVGKNQSKRKYTEFRMTISSKILCSIRKNCFLATYSTRRLPEDLDISYYHLLRKILLNSGLYNNTELHVSKDDNNVFLKKDKLYKYIYTYINIDFTLW